MFVCNQLQSAADEPMMVVGSCAQEGDKREGSSKD
jgi:hypothetical protein